MTGSFEEFWFGREGGRLSLDDLHGQAGEEIARRAWKAAVESAAAEVESWRGGKLLLSAGEMTAQELRTVRAVTDGIARKLREDAC